MKRFTIELLYMVIDEARKLPHRCPTILLCSKLAYFL